MIYESTVILSEAKNLNDEMRRTDYEAFRIATRLSFRLKSL